MEGIEKKEITFWFCAAWWIGRSWSAAFILGSAPVISRKWSLFIVPNRISSLIASIECPVAAQWSAVHCHEEGERKRAEVLPYHRVHWRGSCDWPAPQTHRADQRGPLDEEETADELETVEISHVRRLMSSNSEQWVRVSQDVCDSRWFTVKGGKSRNAFWLRLLSWNMCFRDELRPDLVEGQCPGTIALYLNCLRLKRSCSSWRRSRRIWCLLLLWPLCLLNLLR